MPTGQNRGGRVAHPPPVSMTMAYDGPADDRGRSRSVSQNRTPQAASRAQSFTRIIGYDQTTGRPPFLNRNVDFGGQAYQLRSGVSHIFILS